MAIDTYSTQNTRMPDKTLTDEEIARNRQMVKYVRRWIKYLSLTQAKVADLMGYSGGTFSKWLSGQQGMSVAQFQQLSDILGIPPEAMLSPPGDKEAAERMRRLLSLATKISDKDLDAFESLMAHRTAPNQNISANEK